MYIGKIYCIISVSGFQLYYYFSRSAVKIRELLHILEGDTFTFCYCCKLWELKKGVDSWSEIYHTRQLLFSSNWSVIYRQKPYYDIPSYNCFFTLIRDEYKSAVDCGHTAYLLSYVCP
jgi:hypothetical protein